MPGEYNISATFNSSTNHFEKRGNDENQQASLKDPLHVPVGRILEQDPR
jgi:hypothetical protein